VATLDNVERRLSALLAADAVGYSRLMSDDDLATVRTITDYRALISGRVVEHSGRVVDAPGDNVLAEFGSPLDATRCALVIQDALAERNAELAEERRMHFRIGVHLGDVMADGDRLYGDGVNVAARLEALAERGGICVSSPVYEQVNTDLDAEFHDLGERDLKNIAQPVHVYATSGIDGPDRPTSGPPAIAVLRFDDLSRDPEHEFLAEAIAADLIAQLSAWRVLPVIARSSSFTYKGATADPRRVSRELGARYLVTGSVRAVGKRVRVSAELVDAGSGHQIWSERFDRPLDEIFEVQDEVTLAIGTALQPVLRGAESERARSTSPRSLEVWARIEHARFELQSDISNPEVARASLATADEVLASAPDHALAHALRAFALSLLLPDVASNAQRDEVDASARRALDLSQDDPNLWQLQGATMGNLGRTDDAIRAHQRALELDPNNAQARGALGVARIFIRDPEGALATIDRAIALSPRDPLMYHWLAHRALANLIVDRVEAALADARAALQRRSTRMGRMTLACALAELGRIDEARVASDELKREFPGLDIEQLEPLIYSLAPGPADGDRFMRALRAAGFGEAEQNTP